MEQRESSCKLEENPYGYKAKEINTPKGNSIAFCGNFVNSLLTDTNARNTLSVRYKDKEESKQLDVRSESVCLAVDQSLLQQYEDAWIFKPEIGLNQAVVLQISGLDETEFGGVFDSNFLYSIKVDNTTRYAILKVIKSDGLQVPDDILDTVGKWIGSVATSTIPSGSTRKEKEMAIYQLATIITKEFSNPDVKKLKKEHKYFADARWGSLKKFQSHSEFDPTRATDPLGNTVAHLSVFNHNSDVFMTVAKAHSKLLTVQNIFGNTPLHNIGLIHRRQKVAKYFDWKLFWELPWDYSIKNKRGQTGVEKLCELPANELVVAFKALLGNTTAWQSVIKCHDVSKLMSAAVVGYLSNQIQRASDEEDTKVQVQYFVEKGANDKQAMFDAALTHCQVSAAKYLLDLGATISFENVATAVITRSRPIVDVVIKKFDFNLATADQVNSLCHTVVLCGWNDIAHLLAKRGGKFPLQWNNSNETPIAMANAVAQMNSSAVLPLKYACVDAIDGSLKSDELAKKLAMLPEEIRVLFPAKDLWRWTLFLNDETKCNRFLQLYGAINSAQRSADNEKKQITVGNVEFLVMNLRQSDMFGKNKETVGLKIWPGNLNNFKEEEYYEFSLDKANLSKKGPMPPRRKKETNIPILDHILESLGWPLEDTFVFLMICFNAYSPHKDDAGNVKHTSAKEFFFPSSIDAHVTPPTWFTEFINNCYGINEPASDVPRTREKTHEF